MATMLGRINNGAHDRIGSSWCSVNAVTQLDLIELTPRADPSGQKRPIPNKILPSRRFMFLSTKRCSGVWSVLCRLQIPVDSTIITEVMDTTVSVVPCHTPIQVGISIPIAIDGGSIMNVENNGPTFEAHPISTK